MKLIDEIDENLYFFFEIIEVYFYHLKLNE